MNEIIKLLERKLEHLKKKETHKILKVNLQFLKAYDDFLDAENVETLDQVDTDMYYAQLKRMKTLVRKITAVEQKNETQNTVQKKAASAYQKMMK